jgi:hypothetical protein
MKYSGVFHLGVHKATVTGVERLKGAPEGMYYI